jgi:rod shape-determining protein MreC
MRKYKKNLILSVLVFFSFFLVLLDLSQERQISFLSPFFSPVYYFYTFCHRLRLFCQEKKKEIADFKKIKAENNLLHYENQYLQRKLEEMKKLKEENKQLRFLLKLKRQVSPPLVVAEIIGHSPLVKANTFLISPGYKEGVSPGMVAVWGPHLIGRIREVFPSLAKVELITHSTSSVGARLEKSGTCGVFQGVFGEKKGLLKYIPQKVKVEKGEKVFTSGLGRIFPPDLIIGRIVKIEKTKSPFLYLEVQPFLDFYQLKRIVIIKK